MAKATINKKDKLDITKSKIDVTLHKRKVEFLNSKITKFEATLQYQSNDDQLWNWERIDTESFEVMHGLYRICRILPDKIHTAFDINIENLPNPEDDGRFLIDLCLNLCTFFRDMQAQRIRWGQSQILEDQVVYSSKPHNTRMRLKSHLTLIGVIDKFISKLNNHNKCLALRDTDLIDQSSKDCQILATDIVFCYRLYESFIRTQLLKLTREQRTQSISTSQ